MKKIYLIIMLLFPLLTTETKAANLAERPFWINGYFKEASNSYIEVVSASGNDFQEAREKAAREIVKRRSLATGADVRVSINNQNLTITSEHNLIVKARVIDEYVEHTYNGYRVYILVQTAKNPTYDYEPVNISDYYGLSARAFIPGMAQIYKGSKIKGTSIIITEILSIAGIIICENQRSSYKNKIIEQPKFAKEYSNKATNWETGRNIAIGAAACVYAYNIIDAIVAKGKKRIIIGKTDKEKFAISPYVSTNATGISFAFHF